MDSIILKKEMSCTATAFLESALGDCAEPERNARNSIFSAMITCGSSLLAALAKKSDLQRTYKTHVGDKQKTFTTSRKGIREWLSRWLGKFSFNAENFFLERAQDMVTSGTNVAIDASDISKEFGGEGMEGMERGHDGSRHVTAMGHAVIATSIVPKGRENAVPLVVKVHKGRKKVFEAEKNMIGRIVEKLGNAIQFVMDRGYDNAELVHFLSTNHHKAVIRAKDSVSRDIFADGLTIAKSLSKEKCRVATLKRAKGGTQNVELRYNVGYFPCETQTYHCDNAHVPVMVVSSRFDGKEIFLYVLRDSFESMTAADLNAIAENATQASIRHESRNSELLTRRRHSTQINFSFSKSLLHPKISPMLTKPLFYWGL